eukprot:snap_masked-scaffold1197_size55989-processed-gene-0.5 protein:Tk09667 transcript:snap_masked-scaffold1197_size55989-processed-gene-0.5-mRNA-1 annotation:"truncated methyl binding protein 2 transcript 1"
MIETALPAPNCHQLLALAAHMYQVPLSAPTHSVRRPRTKPPGSAHEPAQASDSDYIVPLPDGWLKRCTQRKSGATAGSWDMYLTAPNGQRLRSNVELIKFVIQHKIAIDPTLVNFERSNGSREPVLAPSTRSLIKKIQYLTEHDYDPSGLDMVLKPDPPTKTPHRSVHRRPAPTHHLHLSALPPGPWQLKPKQEKYLIRQLAKVKYPTPAQIRYMAQQLRVDNDLIETWFRHNRKAEERARSPPQPVMALDALNNDQMTSTLPSEAGVIMIERDNAECDEICPGHFCPAMEISKET